MKITIDFGDLMTKMDSFLSVIKNGDVDNLKDIEIDISEKDVSITVDGKDISEI